MQQYNFQLWMILSYSFLIKEACKLAVFDDISTIFKQPLA